LALADASDGKADNKWELYDINYLDVSTKQKYNLEKKSLLRIVEDLRKNVEILNVYHDSTIANMLNTGIEINK